jgi:hypothetical protein
VPITLDVHPELRCDGLPDVVTTTAYFVASEAVVNAVKHAESATIGLSVSRDAARAQAVGDLAQLRHGGAQLGDGLVEQAAHIGTAVVEVALAEPQCHAECHQALLGAVVQVALEAAALLVGDGEQAGAAGLDVAYGAGQLDAQPDHLHQQGGGGGDLAE